MEKRAICIPFAFENDMQTGVNIADTNRAIHIYMKNACVALLSAKHYNPNCDVVFATNLENVDIPTEYRTILEKNQITILHIPFDFFRFPGEMKWSLAFYKLCVLKALSESPYDAICYMDTDVFIQGGFDAIWEECQENILLYDINHGLNTKDYIILCDEVQDFLGHKKLITHYGGEFFASSKKNAQTFCSICEKIYAGMLNDGFSTSRGDEFIISLAADEMKQKIKNASPYIYRFWTGASFRLISTCYQYNRILVLHVPAEKERGMIRLFDRYIKNNRIPNDSIVWSMFRFHRRTLKDKVAVTIKSVINYIK